MEVIALVVLGFFILPIAQTAIGILVVLTLGRACSIVRRFGWRVVASGAFFLTASLIPGTGSGIKFAIYCFVGVVHYLLFLCLVAVTVDAVARWLTRTRSTLQVEAEQNEPRIATDFGGLPRYPG